MGLQLVTPPAVVEPVSLPSVKKYLRLDCGNEEDATLYDLIRAAREYVENETDLSVATQTWKLTLDSFPDVIYLPKPPVKSVTSIKYYDANGVQQTLATSAYQVDISSQTRPRIISVDGEPWPDLDDRSSPIEIVFISGFAAVPPTLKQAILLLVTHWYENRNAVVIGSISKEMEFSLASLIRQNWVGELV